MSLLPERLLKTLDVNRMPMFRSDHLREIERKAIRVVEFEGVFTGDDRLMPQLLHPNEATLDRLEKALLLRARHALDVRLLRDELGIDVAHHRAPEVDEELRTGTARSRIAHLPEVVLVAQAKDAAVRDPRDLAPQLARFMV